LSAADQQNAEITTQIFERGRVSGYNNSASAGRQGGGAANWKVRDSSDLFLEISGARCAAKTQKPRQQRLNRGRMEPESYRAWFIHTTGKARNNTRSGSRSSQNS
jgi:hypothetical protein